MNKGKDVKRKHSFQRPLGCHHILTMMAYSTSIILQLGTQEVKNEQDKLSDFLFFAVLVIFTILCIQTLIINFRDSSHMGKFDKESEEKTLPKTCTICEIKIEEKTKHCRACNKCVRNFDHHCVWLNTCVGSANYSLFIKILITSFTLTLIKLILNLKLFFNKSAQTEKTMLYLTLICTQIILDLLFTYFVGDLIVFHAYLKVKGISTYEHIMKQRRLKKAKEEKKEEVREEEVVDKGSKLYFKREGILGKSGKKSIKSETKTKNEAFNSEIFSKSQKKNEEEILVQRKSEISEGLPRLGSENRETEGGNNAKEVEIDDEIKIEKNLEFDFNTDINDDEEEKGTKIVEKLGQLEFQQNKFLEKINEENEHQNEEESDDLDEIESYNYDKKEIRMKEECDVPSECEDFGSNEKNNKLGKKLSEKIQNLEFRSKSLMKKKNKSIGIGEFSTVTTKKGTSFKSSLSSHFKL